MYLYVHMDICHSMTMLTLHNVVLNAMLEMIYYDVIDKYIGEYLFVTSLLHV